MTRNQHRAVQRARVFAGQAVVQVVRQENLFAFPVQLPIITHGWSGGELESCSAKKLIGIRRMTR